MWQCDCRIMQLQPPWKHSPLTPWWRTDLNSNLNKSLEQTGAIQSIKYHFERNLNGSSNLSEQQVCQYDIKTDPRCFLNTHPLKHCFHSNSECAQMFSDLHIMCISYNLCYMLYKVMCKCTSFAPCHLLKLTIYQPYIGLCIFPSRNVTLMCLLALETRKKQN